ncbi:molybdopterin biosynthesis protein [Rhodobacterales bacterium HKCCE2091]|nr:molybdopterin biosynthesis protein [Rhodobacterales bacterium HKCCE2091]
MIFGPVPLAKAEGAVLAHSLETAGGRLRKGRVLSADDVTALSDAGHDQVIVARLEPGDVGEDAAAARLAAALVPDPEAQGLTRDAAFTGRANLRAGGPGVLALDPAAIAAVNAIDPGITLATLPEWQRVATGMMVATVKIIAYAVAEDALARAEDAARGAIRRVAPVLATAELIVTDLKGAEVGRDDKGVRSIEGRLKALGVELSRLRTVRHEAGAVTAALAEVEADLALILTASATSDAADVGPGGLVAAGGELIRFGMPVDPGNLLFLGRLGERPVIGLPGCARSPALNGADWVLERVVCGIDVTASDIAGMGVGGLLTEIPTRPQPRERRRAAPASETSG